MSDYFVTSVSKVTKKSPYFVEYDGGYNLQNNLSTYMNPPTCFSDTLPYSGRPQYKDIYNSTTSIKHVKC
jgi:hypothetical protein